MRPITHFRGSSYLLGTVSFKIVCVYASISMRMDTCGAFIHVCGSAIADSNALANVTRRLIG